MILLKSFVNKVYKNHRPFVRGTLIINTVFSNFYRKFFTENFMNILFTDVEYLSMRVKIDSCKYHTDRLRTMNPIDHHTLASSTSKSLLLSLRKGSVDHLGRSARSYLTFKSIWERCIIIKIWYRSWNFSILSPLWCWFCFCSIYQNVTYKNVK